MKRSFLALILLCSHAGTASAEWTPNEPNSIDKVECHADTAASDTAVKVTRVGDNKFVAKVTQTHPKAIQAEYSGVFADWGHWWDFIGEDQGKNIVFELFTRGWAHDLTWVKLTDANGNQILNDDNITCVINDVPDDGPKD